MNKKLCFGLLLLLRSDYGVLPKNRRKPSCCPGEKTEQQERTEDTAGSEEKEDSKKEDSEKEPDIPVEKADAQQICVFLCGAVNRPGVYYLKEGARLYEGIAAAGGFSQDAGMRRAGGTRRLFVWLTEAGSRFTPGKRQRRFGNPGRDREAMQELQLP